jgi:hypothetical protein
VYGTCREQWSRIWDRYKHVYGTCISTYMGGV